MQDRIELGTYLIAAIIGKKIAFKNVEPNLIKTELKVLRKMGVKIKVTKNKILIFGNKQLKKIYLKTAPYPGFPTDLQAQIMVLMTQANGVLKLVKIYLKIVLCIYLNLKEWVRILQ